jgi:hypothetical protein
MLQWCNFPKIEFIFNQKSMNRKSIFLAFNAKTNKLLRNGEAPMFMRITVASEKVENSLHRSINPKVYGITS